MEKGDFRFENINEGVRSPSDKEYKVAQTFAKKIGMKLDSIGVQKNGNINIKGDVKGKAKEMVISSKGEVVKENTLAESKKINKSQIKKGVRISFDGQEGEVTKVTPKGFTFVGDDYGATFFESWAELNANQDNWKLDENTLTDTPPYAEYGYTKDGVVQCTASRNTCLTRMKTDRQRNPGSKFQMIYAPDLVEGEIFEGINEIKSDKDMVKDGLKYAKKKYKYNPKQMKELVDDLMKMASDALQHKKLYVTTEK